MSKVTFDYSEYSASFNVEADRHEIVRNGKVVIFQPSYLTVSISPYTSTIVEVHGAQFHPGTGATGLKFTTKFYLYTDADRMTAPDYVREAAVEAQRRYNASREG